MAVVIDIAKILNKDQSAAVLLVYCSTNQTSSHVLVSNKTAY